LCLLLATYGFAVFGYVTASLATFFIGRHAADPNAELAGADEIEPLRLEVSALRRFGAICAICANFAHVPAEAPTSRCQRRLPNAISNPAFRPRLNVSRVPSRSVSTCDPLMYGSSVRTRSMCTMDDR
jgi:hypothetical protein